MAAQVLDEFVGDEQRLAVEALDQLAQPVDLAGRGRKPDRRRPRHRGSRWRAAPACRSRSAPRRPRSSALRSWRTAPAPSSGRSPSPRRAAASGVTTTLSGGRSGMSASATVIATVPKSAAICCFGSRQGHPLAPERIARPEVPLLPGHEGAAPERAGGDDGRRHEQILARIRPRRAGQAPARAKAPGDLRQRAGALAAWILEARGLVDHQHVEERMIVRNGGELADEPGHEIDTDHRHLALGAQRARSARRRSGLPSRTATRRCRRCGQAAISCGHTVVATSFGAMTRACRRCRSRISSAIAVSAAAPLPAPSGAIRKAASRS